MKNRKFVVDVTVTFPKGEGTKDWSFVGHEFFDLNEGYLQRDGENIGVKLAEMVSEWCDKYPRVHSCVENVYEDEEGYFCAVCLKELTSEIEDVLKLVEERKTNALATDIVSS